MLSGTYYARNYAGIIGASLTTVPFNTKKTLLITDDNKKFNFKKVEEGSKVKRYTNKLEIKKYGNNLEIKKHGNKLWMELKVYYM